MEEVIMSEDTICVAVGKHEKEGLSLLSWAIHYSGGMRICILYVHQPPNRIPHPLGPSKTLAKYVNDRLVSECRNREKLNMDEILHKYKLLCRKMGVRAMILKDEMEIIEEGIVKLITENGIKRLVMGAAAQKHYNRNMTDLRSKKAKYVREHAPMSCLIQFICKGCLIHTRKSVADTESTGSHESSLLITRSRSVPLGNMMNRSNDLEIGGSNCMRSRSVAQDYNWDGINNIGSTSTTSALNSINAFQGGTEELSSPKSTIRRSDAGGSCTSIELDALSRSASSIYSPRGVHDFTLSHQLPQQTAPTLILDHQVFGFSASSPNLGCSTSTSTSDPTKFASNSNINGAQSCVADRSFDNSNYGKLQQVMLEAEKLTLFQQKVASQFREAMGQAQEELICRSREIEEAKVKGEELEKMKNQIYQVMEHIQTFQQNQTSLEKQIAKLQVDRDNAIKKAEELRNTQGEYLSGNMRIQFSEFSPSVIKEATQNFDESLKIGGGGFGNVYRGLVLQTDVAIKRLQSTCGQGMAEFQAEVRVLSQLSHPNLVKLIGCCPEESALVYEYLPNGSLLDRLRCRDNTPSIPWETRLRIIKELCSVLTYLHSRKPHSFVHGDLKPSNILLDENFVCKLSDFGICRELCHDQCSNKDTTLCRITRPKGTSDYIDPDFFETGKLTMKADVYSFGIILLELLTNRSPSFVIFDVKLALETGNLEALLDQSAGHWPLSVAKDLAELALKCCDKNRKNRPKLESDVWKVLESLSIYKFVASSSS